MKWDRNRWKRRHSLQYNDNMCTIIMYSCVHKVIVYNVNVIQQLCNVDVISSGKCVRVWAVASCYLTCILLVILSLKFLYFLLYHRAWAVLKTLDVLDILFVFFIRRLRPLGSNSHLQLGAIFHRKGKRISYLCLLYTSRCV